LVFLKIINPSSPGFTRVDGYVYSRFAITLAVDALLADTDLHCQ
jgi:hypothetical protein